MDRKSACLADSDKLNGNQGGKSISISKALDLGLKAQLSEKGHIFDKSTKIYSTKFKYWVRSCNFSGKWSTVVLNLNLGLISIITESFLFYYFEVPGTLKYGTTLVQLTSHAASGQNN